MRDFYLIESRQILLLEGGRHTSNLGHPSAGVYRRELLLRLLVLTLLASPFLRRHQSLFLRDSSLYRRPAET